MLKITLFFAAKKLTAPTLAGLQEYKKRLSQSCQLEWKTAVAAVAMSADLLHFQSILLDRGGQSLKSPELASQIQTWMTSGKSQLHLYVGVLPKESEPILERLSLSPVALGENTAGLLMAEQIYRAFRILEGKAYHK